MTRSVLIADREAAERADVRRKLADRLPDVDVTVPDEGFEWSPAEIRTHADAGDVIVTALSSIDASVVEGVPDLSYVVKTGVGIDNVAVDAATDRGVLVSRTPGVNDQGIAEHVVGMAIALQKRMLEADRRLRAGDWAFRESLSGNTFELRNRTIGIVGLGAIGRRLAEVASGIGMDVVAQDPYVDEATARAHDATLVGLDDLLERSHVVSLNCLLTEETHHLIGEAELDRISEDAYLVNTSRGPVVDESALVAALRDGDIAGAGIDVFEKEPPADDNPLFELENVVVTPHTAGTTYEGYQRIGDAAVADIERFFDGGLPVEDHVVNPEVLDGYDHPFA